MNSELNMLNVEIEESVSKKVGVWGTPGFMGKTRSIYERDRGERKLCPGQLPGSL